MSTPPLATECKFDDLYFAPPVTNTGKTTVDMYWSSESTAKSNRLKFAVATDDIPARAMYGLDSAPQDGGNQLRRTQKLYIEDPEVVKQLQMLDEVVLDTAVKNSALWFRKSIDREAIVARYNPVLTPEGDKFIFKMKVKCPGHEVPTKLHLCNDFATLTTQLNGGRIEDLQRNALLMPIVSTMGLYFVGNGLWGLSFQCDELIVKKADLPHPLASFKTSKPFNIVKDLEDTEGAGHLQRSFDELQEEITRETADPPADSSAAVDDRERALRHDDREDADARDRN